MSIPKRRTLVTRIPLTSIFGRTLLGIAARTACVITRFWLAVGFFQASAGVARSPQEHEDESMRRGTWLS